MKNSLLFSETYEKLFNEIQKNNLLPIGETGTLPIHKSKKDVDYPKIIKFQHAFSHNKLLEDFNTTKSLLKKYGEPAFGGYSSYFIQTQYSEVLKMLGELGFSKDRYEVYQLSLSGQSELLPIVGDYTRDTLNKIGRNFWQLYVTAKPDWSLKPHIDHKDMSKFGFKVFLPINEDRYIGWICKHKKIQIYKLLKGIPYFLNVTLPHFAVNPTSSKSIALNFHIAEDKGILKGEEMEPEKDITWIEKQIPWIKELYANFDQNCKLIFK